MIVRMSLMLPTILISQLDSVDKLVSFFSDESVFEVDARLILQWLFNLTPWVDHGKIWRCVQLSLPE